MKKIKVTCLCRGYSVGDMGFSLERGDFRYVSEEEYARSKDLHEAQQIKAVTVEVIKLCQTTRDEAPPSRRRQIKFPSSVYETSAVETSEDSSKEGVSVLREEIKGLQKFWVDEIEGLKDLLKVPAAVPRFSYPPLPEIKKPVEDPILEDSFFIPKSIVTSDMKVEVPVSEMQEASALQDSVSILKEMKRAKT